MKTRLKRLLLGLLRALGVFRLARLCTRGQLRILCYHGISIGDQHEYDPVLFMRRETFEKRVHRLHRQGWHIVDLDTAVRQFMAGTLPPYALVITIDDGWVSTYTQMLPLLKEHGLPATLYVTTYYAETGRDVFNAVLYYMTWKTKLDLVHLSTGHASIDGEYRVRSDRLATVAAWIKIADRDLDGQQRQQLLPLIAGCLQLDPVETLTDCRFRIMDRHQIAECAAFRTDIELHTHRHHLPNESLEAMTVEIEENKRRLEDWTGRPCLHFCYPSGVYTTQQSEWLAQLGLRSSTTCDAGGNQPGQHPHRLKRVLDRDNWSDVEFDAALCGFGWLSR